MLPDDARVITVALVAEKGEPSDGRSRSMTGVFIVQNYVGTAICL